MNSKLSISVIVCRPVEEAWALCIPVWRHQGQVRSYPRGVTVTRYQQSFGEKLGEFFAEHHLGNKDFVIGRLKSQDKFEVLCAFEVIEMMTSWWIDTLPEVFTGIDVLIPAEIRAVIDSHWAYKNFRGTTVGELLRYDNQ